MKTMTDAQLDRIASIIANATMVAAIEYARKIGKAEQLRDSATLDRLVTELKRQAVAASDRILDQGKTLVGGGMANWAGTLVQTECATAGIAAVKVVLA